MTQAEVDTSVSLASRASRGESGALDRLLARYFAPLRAWVRARLPGALRSPDRIDALVRDGIVESVDSVHRGAVANDGEFQLQLRELVRIRVEELIGAETAGPGHHTHEEGASPALREVVGAEAYEQYERVLHDLDQPERAAAVARLELGQDWPDVAQVLGLSSAQARSTVSRAVLALAGVGPREEASRDVLPGLASAVADQIQVDWEGHLRRARGSRERDIVHQMRVIEQIARAAAQGADSLVGTMLGHARVMEKIGEGGMGQVYRAHDEHLKRDVAIKVLPAGYLADAEARRQFRNEALSLSRINHPNVETIHDFDTQDGIDYLVMEYVPGKTLRELLADGPLPEPEVTRLGIELAEGLGAAHAQGIVHRDLKPGNLIITPEGRLKVLDFGLAKLVVPDRIGSTTWSFSGRVVGTLPYMAPEQLRGDRVDVRTDIWAFGAVLYEMTTGARPFANATSGDGTAAEPAPFRRNASRELERIALRALEQDPDGRYQNVGQMREELETLRFGRGRRRQEWTRWTLVASIVGMGLLGWAGAELLRRRPPAPVFGSPVRLTRGERLEAQPALSPDGDLLAYSSDESGNPDIWVLDTRRGAPVRLTEGAESDTSPGWLPDGSAIVFQRVGVEGPSSIWRVARLGGSAVRLLDNAGEPAVSPDGQKLAFVRPASSGLLRIAVASLGDLSTVRMLTDDQDGLWDHEHPTWSPDGRTVCYSDFGNLWTVPASGGAAARLTTDNRFDFDPEYSPDGSWVYFSSMRDGTLAIWRADLRGRRLERVTLGAASESHPSLSRAGDRLVYGTSIEDTDIVIVNRATGGTFTIGTSARELHPSLAPDGSALALVTDWDSRTEIWLQPLSNGVTVGPPRALLEGPGTVGMSAFSPDGRWLAISRVLDGDRDVWIVPVAGGPPRNLTHRKGTDMHPTWSPDGSSMAWVSSREGRDRLFVAQIENGRLVNEREIAVPNDIVWHPSWSPDGRVIAFVSRSENGFDDVWLVASDGNEAARRVTTNARVEVVRWDSNSGELLASGTWGSNEMEIRAVSPATGVSTRLEPRVLIGRRGVHGDFDTSRDGSVLAYRVTRMNGDLWMVAAQHRR